MYTPKLIASIALGIIMSLTGAASAGEAVPNQQPGPHFGPWTFSSFTVPSGRFYCAITSTIENKDAGQNIVIKGSPSLNHLVADLYKDKWNRKQGATVNVMFDFVNNHPITFQAYADAHILDIEINTDQATTVLLGLTKQPGLQVIFPDDENAGTWFIRNDGAKEAVQKMISCLEPRPAS